MIERVIESACGLKEAHGVGRGGSGIMTSRVVSLLTPAPHVLQALSLCPCPRQHLSNLARRAVVWGCGERSELSYRAIDRSWGVVLIAVRWVDSGTHFWVCISGSASLTYELFRVDGVNPIDGTVRSHGGVLML